MVEYQFDDIKIVIHENAIKHMFNILQSSKNIDDYFEVDEYNAKYKIPLLEIFPPVLVNVIMEYNVNTLFVTCTGSFSESIFFGIDDILVLIDYRNVDFTVTIKQPNLIIHRSDICYFVNMLYKHSFDKVYKMSYDEIHAICENETSNKGTSILFFMLISLFRHHDKMKILFILVSIFKLIIVK